MDTCTHLILTRFNVKLGFINDAHVTDGDWLAERFTLFERYCLPSVRAQTRQRFKWLVFLDAETPASARQRIEAFGALIPCYVDSFRGELRKHVAQHMNPTSTHLVTSRLDADDALGRRYVEVVQQHFCGQDGASINLVNGYIIGGDKLYEARRSMNAFISFVERVENFKTVHYMRHTELGQLGDVLDVDVEPLWLQVVHGTNVKNRVTNSLRVPRAMLPLYFETNVERSNREHMVLIQAERVVNRVMLLVTGALRSLRARLVHREPRPLDPLS